MNRKTPWRGWLKTGLFVGFCVVFFVVYEAGMSLFALILGEWFHPFQPLMGLIFYLSLCCLVYRLERRYRPFE